jgi:hypothetical protein
MSFAARRPPRAGAKDFRQHAATLSELLANVFGPAQDFSRSGDTVYFVLPTTVDRADGRKALRGTGRLVLCPATAGRRLASGLLCVGGDGVPPRLSRV